MLKLQGTKTATFTYAGVEVVARSLSLVQVRAIRGMTPDESDATAIAWSLGMDVAEATAWFEQASVEDAMFVLGEVLKVSGLSEGAQKSSGAGDGPVAGGDAQ